MAAANDTNFDEVEVRVREMVPEYGRIYKECNDLIRTRRPPPLGAAHPETTAAADADLSSGRRPCR